MRIILTLLLIALMPQPAHADWLVFRNGEKESTEVWKKQPVAGRNVPAGCKVVSIPNGTDPRKFMLENNALVQKPKKVTALTQAQKDERQAAKTINEKLADPLVTDSQWLKLFRLKNTPGPKKEKLEAILAN